MSNKKSKKIRHIVQIGFFIVVLSIVIGKALNEAGIIIPFLSTASLHAVCPFGGVVSIYNYLASGTLVQKIHSSSIILMYAVFFLSILFGPVFCSWMCPLGTVQEFLGKIGKKIFGKRYNHIIPAKIDQYLRYLRYVVLALVIYNTAVSAKLVFQDVDPYYALFNMFTGEVAISAYIVLAVTLLLSLIIERPFCKYACPYGALLGTTNLVRLFKVKRNSTTCVNCKACDTACPMNIEVSSKNKIYNHQCISCLECTSESKCPVQDTVMLSLGGKK
ncbi:4Fe-4S binding protein [Paludicola sp. MB14-C6]|uniref:4Fe-4S binding protein n=1 Tax=Paludihabitans sp. MB14-C6 TaxID=3070656 RepID=UPI0027DE838C|nr:4Fe-4S binding protein [Paludicola sp. MB14-C6]WMJ23730.1 4Fe-4S binding protein [Paludicola sp. MB14-C6]